MNRSIKTPLPLIVAVLCSLASSQVIKTFPHGIGFEVGLGHNQMSHQVHANPPINDAYTHYRETLFITPTFRVSYELYPQNWLPIRTFIGYDVSGGKSDKQQNGYQDKYTFRQIELGITASYSYKNFAFGAGVKYNHHLKVINEAYGSVNEPANSERSWSENDVSELFLQNSTDIGLRIAYTVNHFLISTEAWFGISDLENQDISDYVDVRKNRYILLIGYQL